MSRGTRAELLTHAKLAGLTVETHAPGDGVTRYYFAPEQTPGRYIGRALGLREAHTWLAGYDRGREATK